ncbi:insulin-like 5a [Triplophysa rosa]|uniref:Insulin-like 5a n=1 Tax=Triplophysa rosa TaxID=992332 RepID=A0A9W7WT15_TRIRA|nr:insulin-like 5a [Triplophysa rosa]KAI7807723.1 insulin-like 5a precursor [Triplophysa rosa]
MRMLHAPTLLLPVLLLWAVCSVSEAQAEVRTVKLCGREFIRAVVYTCGGSRWRRLSSPQDMEEESRLFNGDPSSTEALSEAVGSDLTRRDLNNVMTNICCQVGCKKSDLAFLC